MLCVDVEKRLTIEQCLAHHWLVSGDDSFASETPLEHHADSKLSPPRAPLLENSSSPDTSPQAEILENLGPENDAGPISGLHASPTSGGIKQPGPNTIASKISKGKETMKGTFPMMERAQTPRSTVPTESTISNHLSNKELWLQPWVSYANDVVTGSPKELPSRGASDEFAENQRLLGAKTDYDENIYTITIDKKHPQYRERLAAAEKKAREIERTAHTAIHDDEETCAATAEKLDELPEAVQDDLKFNDMGVQGSSWTFTEGETTPEHQIPLKIDGHPVIIPVRYYYPLMAISSPPPDPHPRIISTLDPLLDDTISDIFATFTGAVGFYLLVNGYLQIIVPEDFDYESSIPSLPDQFGGLKVSFIPQSLYPTAGDPGATVTPSREILRFDTFNSITRWIN